MARKRKKAKHKKRIRSSTKTIIFIICGVLAVISLISLYSNMFVEETESKEETIYKYSDQYKQQYKVNLKPNEYMENESLSENEVYVTDLIDKLKLNLNYTYEGETPDKINCTYKVTGKLKSTYSLNGKEEEIWNKEYIILEEKEQNTTEKVLDINEDVDVDLQIYNKLVKDFIDKMEMALTTTLYIQFEANVTAYTNGEMILDQYKNHLEVSIGEKVTKITGKEEDFKQKTEKRTVETIIEKEPIVAVISTIVLIISVYIMLKVQRETKTSNKITNMFKVELNQILGACGDRIVKIDSPIKTIGRTIIELKDINELVKLSEELYKPILYYQVSNKNEAWFCLSVENETYRYILK